MKIKWSIDELMTMCVQEEERLKAQKVDHINQFKETQKNKFQSGFKPKPRRFKKKGESSKPNIKEKAPKLKLKPMHHRKSVTFVRKVDIFKRIASNF